MSYLPMNCPNCGRRRLEPEIVTTDDRGDLLDFPFVSQIKCEKCGRVWPDCEDVETTEKT